MTTVRIAVTGVGVICALGRDQREYWRNAIEGRSGIDVLRLFNVAGVAGRPVGQVRDDPRGALADRREANKASRTELFCMRAALEAVTQAGLAHAEAASPLGSFGVSLGSSTAGMLEAELWCSDLAARGVTHQPLADVLRLPTSAPADAVARLLRTAGPRLSNTTACASSALSIAHAAELIRNGDAPGMIAGGGDALCRMTYAGFHALRLLDPRACRPFDASRQGLSLGEGAGMLVLERWDHALARGARPLAEYLEHGASCDAHHATAPHPEGRGAVAAMVEALARAGLSADRIGHIQAHGTGTPLNDLAEAQAIHRVFGAGHSCRVPVTSSKSMTGHLLGGCGGLAAATVVLSLMHQMVPPTLGWESGDDSAVLDVVAGRARPLSDDYAMSNSFGFGGTNCSLIFGRAT